MTILFMDGFDYYSSTMPVSNRWGSSGNVTYGVAGRFGGYCVTGSAFNPNITNSFPSAKSALSIGFALKTGGGNPNSVQFKFLNGSTTICSFGIDTTGKLTFYRGSSTVLAAVTNAVSVGIWHHIGVEFTRNTTTGSVNFYVDGVKVINLTGVNTGSSDIDSFNIALGTDSSSGVDDYYAVDGATWLGEMRIKTLYPSADTAQKDWTPNSGANNYSRVSEANFDGDTSYVSATTVGNTDIYDLGNLGYTPASVKAVQTILCGRKDDAATRTVAPVLVSGATTHQGLDVAMASNYNLGAEIYEADPNTSSTWSPSAVDALQLGLKVTT